MTNEQCAFILAHCDREDLQRSYGGMIIRDTLLREIEAVATARLREHVEEIEAGWWASGWGEPPNVYKLRVVLEVRRGPDGYEGDLSLQEPMQVITMKTSFASRLDGSCDRCGGLGRVGEMIGLPKSGKPCPECRSLPNG